MKNIFLIATLALILASCSVKKNQTLSYNHVRDEPRLEDTLQGRSNVEIGRQMDDEFEIILHGYRISKIVPVGFPYEYDMDYINGRVYFYSPDMSKYMEKNEWFTFIITYQKRYD